MPNESIKAELIDLLKHARADELEFIASLNDADRSAIGTIDQWAPKDLIAHFTFWRTIMLKRLIAAQAGETPPNPSAYLEWNDRAFEENRHRPWSEILDDSQHAFVDLIAKVQEMTDDQLTDPNRYEWRKGEPLWTNVRGNSYDHPETHLSQAYYARGNKARAIDMQRALMDNVIRLDPSPRARGTAIYNFGCVLALYGEHAQAIDMVHQSFSLRPDLVEWSKQDSDMESLRSLPKFQALYQHA